MGGVFKKALDPAGLFSSDSPNIVIPPAPPPVVLPPSEMPAPAVPTSDDVAAKQARRRSLMRQYSRRGRQSTVLSDESETLG